MYYIYSKLNAQQKAQVETMFDLRISGDPNDHAYEVLKNGDVLCRKAKSLWHYREYKIHWNGERNCWRFYDRGQAIDTLTPERDIDLIIDLLGYEEINHARSN